MAKQHRDKLTHISPVWYQLKLQDGAPHLAGGHDADAEWMAELRAPTADVRPQQYIYQSLTHTRDRGCVHLQRMLTACPLHGVCVAADVPA